MIELKKMTRELCHELYKGWSNDASIYMDMSLFKPYSYNKASVDLYFDSKNEPSRIIFAIKSVVILIESRRAFFASRLRKNLSAGHIIFLLTS